MVGARRARRLLCRARLRSQSRAVDERVEAAVDEIFALGVAGDLVSPGADRDEPVRVGDPAQGEGLLQGLVEREGEVDAAVFALEDDPTPLYDLD
ncbi:Uncharacterised protein [Mycobacterium tuberculosis]|nr:Uncharacterised protein [Mycobacterium tuberculosis]